VPPTTSPVATASDNVSDTVSETVQPEPPTEGVAPEVVDVPRDVVEPGDCLWTIAARHLGPSASDADIDRYWRFVYERNRAVVGDDPNLIVPGQELVLPEER